MYLNVNTFADRASDSEMIQAALDTAVETGQFVLIPKINARTGKALWDIDKTILLHNDSTLILHNCHLRQADGCICNMFANANARTPLAHIREGQQRSITVKGIGTAVLDGGVHNGLYEANGIARSTSKYPDHSTTENCMMYFENVERLQIDNLCIKNQRYWAICMYTVVNSHISNIHFSSDSNVPNQDGVDLQKGCHDVIVENITGCVGDNIVALLATNDAIYTDMGGGPRDGDIHNITIRNIMCYGVGGCSLIRLLNHDGHRIYNVYIDNVIEVSPWSDQDAPVAQNPDLIILQNEKGEIYHARHLTPGEEGYRCESAIIIGESYWYSKSKAQPGDTYGIHISNVMTHARYGVFLNNTLQDSVFENIRMFGNGFMAVYFGEGTMENLQFSNILYDKDCRPLPADEHVRIDWNHTSSDGFSPVYCNGTHMKNVVFRNLRCSGGMERVFGGYGTGEITCREVDWSGVPHFAQMDGITVHAE